MAARSKACGTVTVGGRAQSLVSNPPLHVGQQAITTPLVLCLQMCLTQLLPPIVFLINWQGTPLWALHCGIYLKPLQGQVWCPKCNYYMNYDANLFLISLTHTCTHTHTYHPGKLFNVHHRLWPGLHFCCCSVHKSSSTKFQATIYKHVLKDDATQTLNSVSNNSFTVYKSSLLPQTKNAMKFRTATFGCGKFHENWRVVLVT